MPSPIVARAIVPIPSAGVIAGQREAIQRRIWDEMRREMRSVSREERGQLRDQARERIDAETNKVLASYLTKVDGQINPIAEASTTHKAKYSDAIDDIF